MTLFVDRLTQLDVSLWCPRRGLVGASWHVDAELDGELGEDGMLFDFGEVRISSIAANPRLGARSPAATCRPKAAFS